MASLGYIVKRFYFYSIEGVLSSVMVLAEHVMKVELACNVSGLLIVKIISNNIG